jgi:hypothetical protein
MASSSEAQAGSAAWALAAAIGFTPSDDGSADQEAVNEVVLVCFSAAHWDEAATLRLVAQKESAVRDAKVESNRNMLGMGAVVGCIACAMAILAVRRRRLQEQAEWVVDGAAACTPGSGSISNVDTPILLHRFDALMKCVGG